MIICPGCKKQLSDGTKFCNNCGYQLQPMNSSARMQTNFTQAPAHTQNNKNPKYIYAIIALLLAIIIVSVGWLILSSDKNKETDHEQKLLEILEENSAKPVVEFLYDDFDSDGTKESFAVVGQTDDKDAEHPEYYDADIFFVNETEAEIIKENVSGKSNGTITIDDNIYVSLEVYENGKEEGYSFIYTSSGDTYEEPEISGKHSNVHEENGKIFAIDDNRKVEIDFLDKPEISTTENTSSAETTTEAETTTKAPATVSEGTIIEPNASDWEEFDHFIYSCEDAYVSPYDCNSTNRVKDAYKIVWGNGTAWFFQDIYNISGTEVQSDPLGKMSGWSVKYYPAKDVDSFIKNVLNITPDRSVTGYSDDGSVLYYYYEDKFYTAQGGRGDTPIDIRDTTYTPIGNGKYKTESYTGFIGQENLFKITATVALKSVDGKRVWSVYSYNKTRV